MSALAMFSVALAVAIFHISNINCMRDSDIENVLGQLPKKGFSLQHSPLDPSLERDENTSDDFQELVQNIVRSPQIQTGFPYKDKDFILDKKDRKKKHTWRQILYVKPAWIKAVHTPRKQNYPLNNLEHEDGDNDLGDYSKMYLVLDPDVDLTESDVRDLSNMVSVLAKPSTPRKSPLKDRIKKKRYKGFVVKDNIMNRRRMRDSKEMYAEKASIERDYKPKRPRAEYRGGAGRTAIPYIRHRGDIYEKE